MTAVVVIPARFDSTRFSGKIVASKTGRPLVQHVVDQVRKCERVREIVVAADDPRIAEALAPYGTTVVMTSPDHPSGTDRIAEVAGRLDDAIVVNVQGDEPEIEPEIVDGLIARLEQTGGQMATAATPFVPPNDPQDPNLVKVVLDNADRAIYFSRSLIPFQRDPDQGDRPTYYLHLGVYAYARPFLLRLAKWKPTSLERAEKLEQLRALEYRVAIDVVKVARATHGIDTPQQYQAFVARWQAAIVHQEQAEKKS